MCLLASARAFAVTFKSSGVLSWPCWMFVAIAEMLLQISWKSMWVFASRSAAALFVISSVALLSYSSASMPAVVIAAMVIRCSKYAPLSEGAVRTISSFIMRSKRVVYPMSESFSSRASLAFSSGVGLCAGRYEMTSWSAACCASGSLTPWNVVRRWLMALTGAGTLSSHLVISSPGISRITMPPLWGTSTVK